MAIGGSITDTTQASTWKQPSTSSPWSQAGAWSATKSWCSCSSTQNRKVDSHWDGIFAPAMVIQNTSARSSSITG